MTQTAAPHPSPPATAARRSPSAPQQRRRLRSGGWTFERVGQLVAAAVGAVSTVWIGYERLLPTSGSLGFWLLSYLVFLVLYAVVVGATEGAIAVRDRLAAVLFTTAGLSLVSVLALIVGFTTYRGYHSFAHVGFFTHTLSGVQPDAGLAQGGVYAAIVGTLEQVAVAMAVAVPLGITTAIYLNEVRGRLARVVRTVVETMTAIPSILAGLFILATVVLSLGVNRCGFAAALALGVEMLPVVTRTAEVVLRLVPNSLREASYALGSSQARTVRKVVLPTARSGLVTAVLLGVARVVGETSPVLLVAGFTNELNKDPLHGPQVSLPLFIFDEVRFPIDVAIARAFGAALALLVLVLVLFTAARLIAGRGPGSRSMLRGPAHRASVAVAVDAPLAASLAAPLPVITPERNDP